MGNGIGDSLTRRLALIAPPTCRRGDSLRPSGRSLPKALTQSTRAPLLRRGGPSSSGRHTFAVLLQCPHRNGGDLIQLFPAHTQVVMPLKMGLSLHRTASPHTLCGWMGSSAVAATTASFNDHPPFAPFPAQNAAAAPSRRFSSLSDSCLCAPSVRADCQSADKWIGSGLHEEGADGRK